MHTHIFNRDIKIIKTHIYTVAMMTHTHTHMWQPCYNSAVNQIHASAHKQIKPGGEDTFEVEKGAENLKTK